MTTATETAAPYTVERYDSEEAWLAARRSGIGASEAAVILGLSKWGSPFSVWAEKCGVQIDHEEAERMAWGRVLEAPIAERYAKVTGRMLEDPGRHTIHRSIAHPWMFATLDRRIVGDPRGSGLLEVKNVSQFVRDEWEGDEPPLAYQIQCQWQMAVVDVSWGALVALIGGQRLVHFDVERNDRFIASMIERLAEFWQRVQRREPPEVDASDATADVLAKLYPQETGTTVALSDESDAWHAERVDAAEQIKRYTEIKDAATNRLKAAIGEATFGTTPGGVRYKWATKHVKEFVVKEKSYRELRLVK